MPRLSVIMPVKNGADHLPTTLASLAASLPRDAQVRVMDDGSDDATTGLLAAAAERDRRFVIHRHETSQGVARSLNELAAAADCEYLARMDADDVVLINRWRTTMREFARYAGGGDAGPDMVFTSVVFVDEAGRVRGVDQPGRIRPEATPYHLLLGSMLVHPTVTMRRSVFDELGGYAIVPAEDYELWLRAAAAGKRLLRTAVPGLKYRRHSGQVTVRRPWRDPDPDSPMVTAYGALLERVLGERPGDWDTVFVSALGSTVLDRHGAEASLDLYRQVAEAAAQNLGRFDAAGVQLRALREGIRVRRRAAGA